MSGAYDIHISYAILFAMTMDDVTLMSHAVYVTFQ